MRICDVDVLEIQIGDAAIGTLLKNAQHNIVKETLQVKAEQRRLETTKQVESVKQAICDLTASSEKKLLEVEKERTELEAAILSAKLGQELSNQDTLDGIASSKLNRKVANDNQRLEALKAELMLESDAYTKKFNAITPGLVEAIVGLGNKQLATALAENLPKAEGSLGLLLGINGIDQLRNMVTGTAMDRALDHSKIKKLTEARQKSE
jgi:hypothetical protein